MFNEYLLKSVLNDWCISPGNYTVYTFLPDPDGSRNKMLSYADSILAEAGGFFNTRDGDLRRTFRVGQRCCFASKRTLSTQRTCRSAKSQMWAIRLQPPSLDVGTLPWNWFITVRYSITNQTTLLGNNYWFVCSETCRKRNSIGLKGFSSIFVW